MNGMQLFLSSLAGALATATMIALATPPHFEPQPALPIKQTGTIYTCDNVPGFDYNENGAIRELRETCRANAEALLLMEQWQKDPQANIVYE